MGDTRASPKPHLNQRIRGSPSRIRIIQLGLILEEWIAEGWWEIAQGDCTEAITGPLQQRYYYIRAEGTNNSIWSGDYFFCTMQTRFLVVDSENCVSQVMDREGFWQIDTGDSTDHVHNFNP